VCHADPERSPARWLRRPAKPARCRARADVRSARVLECIHPDERETWPLPIRASSCEPGLREGQGFVIGRYIVDMLAPSIRLVVEVDGGVHRLRRAADARRDRDLGRLGYQVMRVPAQLVLRNRPAAVALVVAGMQRLRR
jgi:very-short-patch-repair endonuclease